MKIQKRQCEESDEINRKKKRLTAASTFAGDSSLGPESIDMILNMILSTCEISIDMFPLIKFYMKTFLVFRKF